MYYENELYHHGIKGMRWGVRRFQKKDGTLTPAGKKRYDDSSSKEKTKKQSRYDKLYQKYKTLGYDDAKAAQAAKGRVIAERSLAVVGSITVAAVAGYAVYRYRDTNVDRIIKPNQVMQTVHLGDTAKRLEPGNPFYATYTKKDNTIYASRVFSHFNDKSNITKFYTKDGIKVASEKTSRKIFEGLEKEHPEIKDYVNRFTKSTDPKERYKMFNYSLVMNNDTDQPFAKALKSAGYNHNEIHNKFYSALKNRGYGGVIDTNDAKREGFTFNPVIVFDNQIKHVVSSTKATKEDLGTKRTLKGMMYSSLRETVLHPTKDPYIVAGGVAFVSGLGITAKRNRELNKQVKFVEKYRKDHPNTKLSNAEIIKIYDPYQLKTV